MQKNVIFRAEITQNHPGGQKMRFFKVRDIDTIIEPGEKEHQTDAGHTYYIELNITVRRTVSYFSQSQLTILQIYLGG